VDKLRIPAAFVAVVATGAILYPEIKGGVEGAYSGGEAVVRGFNDVVALPGELENDANDCYADTSSSAVENISATALQQKRQNCSTWTGFLEGVIEYGGSSLIFAAGGLAIRRRFTRSSHSSSPAAH